MLHYPNFATQTFDPFEKIQSRRAAWLHCFNFWSLSMTALFSPTALVVPFEKLRMTDVESVGGKNASLGEMISQLPTGVRVPTGFATTAHAFREFLAYDGLADKINARLDKLDTEDVRALAEAGAEIRAMVEAQPFPADLQKAITEAFATLSEGNAAATFAVRSSASTKFCTR
jgi:pyruvate,water dikinase